MEQKTKTEELEIALKTGKVRNKGKLSRNKRKNGRKGGPLSLYVRDKIDATTYFKLTNQWK